MAFGLALAACADPDQSVDAADALADAGAADSAAGSDAGINAPDLPMPPAPPVWDSCAAGWSVSAEGCIPPVAPDTCPNGFAPFPSDGDGCHRVGPACPEGIWPSEVPAGDMVFYVSPDGLGSGDSPDDPSSLDNVARRAPSDTLVVLSKGHHSATAFVRWGRNITLLGACAEQTVVRGYFAVNAGEFTLRNLSVEWDGEILSASSAFAEPHLVLENVVLSNEDPRSFGSTITLSANASLTGSRVDLIAPPGSLAPMGISVIDSGAVNLTDSTIRGFHEAGVAILAGAAEVTLTHTRISTTGARVGAASISLTDGSVAGTSLILSGSGSGVRMTELATDFTCTDCSFAETTAVGIWVGAGRAVLERVRFHATSGLAGVADAAGELIVQDAVVGGADAKFSGGFYAVDGGQLRLERTQLVGVEGVALGSEAGAFEALDVSVESNGFTEDRTLTSVAFATQAGTLNLVRFSAEENAGYGLFAAARGQVTGNDVRVDGLDPRCEDETCQRQSQSIGVVVVNASCTLTRFHVSGAVVGTLIATDGDLDLSNGRLSNLEVGVYSLVAGYDRNRLSDRVIFMAERNWVSDAIEPPSPPQLRGL